MSKCTWLDCDKEAEKWQWDKNGEVWARLCFDHDSSLANAMESGEPRKILGRYVKAQGGAKVAAKRSMGMSLDEALKAVANE